jgi:hypothetical protein
MELDHKGFNKKKKNSLSTELKKDKHEKKKTGGAASIFSLNLFWFCSCKN